MSKRELSLESPGMPGAACRGDSGPKSQPFAVVFFPNGQVERVTAHKASPSHWAIGTALNLQFLKDVCHENPCPSCLRSKFVQRFLGFGTGAFELLRPEESWLNT